MTASFEAGRTALLVMDMQRGILSRYEDTSELLERFGAVIGAARAAGMPVIFVVVQFREGYPEISPRNKSFSALRQSGALTGETAEIHPDVPREPGDVIVTKRRISAFAGSDLDVVLRAHGIESLVLTGIATSGVVLSTLRLAADLDYRLTVLADCCRDRDPEVHRVLTEKVFPMQAEVLTAAEWIAALRQG